MKKRKIWNYVCVALMAILLILQFVPFWSINGQNTSIQAYVWFPDNYGELTSYLEAEVGKNYAIGQIVFPTLAILLTSVAGIVFGLIKWDSPVWKIIPIIGAIIGVWGFLAKPALQQGNTWVFQLILCIGVVVSAAMTVVYSIKMHNKN